MKKQYDFYYSAKQKRQIELTPLNSLRRVLIADEYHEYTEMVEAGKELSSVWDDFIFLGTATDADTVVRRS